MVRSAVIVELRRNPSDTLGNRIGNTVHTPPSANECYSVTLFRTKFHAACLKNSYMNMMINSMVMKA
jgi:hypothetical protein